MHSDLVVCTGLRALLTAATELDWAVQEHMDELQDGIIIADYHNAIALSLRMGPASRQRVLLVTHDGKDGEVRRAIASGVHGYLLQSEAPAELSTAVLYVSNGQRYLSRSVQRCMADSCGHSELTRRESDVLQLMGQGYCNKLIARTLGISLGTVKSHVKAVLDKLHATTRTHAVVIAAQRGLINNEAPGSVTWQAAPANGQGRHQTGSALLLASQ
ncbi:DNA-binding response regulator [Undibacterium sp. TJN25]|uniref:response regulator transcription factor n=1 Tax=Undibacterium sp. TJN25 TaxID=3413056 RepID=UPI003BF026A2